MLVTPATASAAEAAAKGNGHQNIQLDQLGNSKTQNTKKRHGKQSILRSDSSPNSKSSSASRVKLSLSPLPPTFENQRYVFIHSKQMSSTFLDNVERDRALDKEK